VIPINIGTMKSKRLRKKRSICSIAENQHSNYG